MLNVCLYFYHVKFKLLKKYTIDWNLFCYTFTIIYTSIKKIYLYLSKCVMSNYYFGVTQSLFDLKARAKSLSLSLSNREIINRGIK